MHLREVVGDDKKEQNVKLDEQVISREELSQRQESTNAATRIVETKDGEYKTLKRMYS